MTVTKGRIAWMVCVTVLLWFKLLIGTLVAIATVFYWLLADKWKTPATVEPVDSSDDSFGLDLTSDYFRERQGWESWELHPARRRLEVQCCHGGPPTYEDVWEYDVRGTSLYVRLLESSKEAFEGKRYEVFAGQVVRAELEKNHKNTDDEKSLDDEQARLEKRVVWHDVLSAEADGRMAGAVRYFVLTKSRVDRKFLIEERRRLENSLKAVSGEARRLGAKWNEMWGGYEVNDKPAKGLVSTDDLLRFGLHHAELRDSEKILGILTEAGA